MIARKAVTIQAGLEPACRKSCGLGAWVNFHYRRKSVGFVSPGGVSLFRCRWLSSRRPESRYHGPLMRNLARRWAAPLVLSVLVILIYWRLTLTPQYTFLESSDHSYQLLPWLQYQAGEWHAGRIPLWDPNGWLGQPLLAQVQPSTANPLAWLLFLAPLDHGWIRQDMVHWYFVLIRMLAALTCYARSEEHTSEL